jgi:hypothetical protein
MLVLALAIATPSRAGDAPAEIYRGINLNGPPVVIDGRQWEGEANGGAKGVECPDGRFESQDIPLWPETDAGRARMLRSSVWDSSGRGKIVIRDIPPGAYSVFLYVWEDNDSQTFSVSLQGKTVAQDVESGSGGKWQRLGPWPVQVADGRIELTASGGHANLSGIELWKGNAPAASIPTVKPAPALPPPKTTDRKAGYDWWSFQPVDRPAPPQVKNAGWVRNPVDAFVLARLEKEGLAPSAEAERRTLVRRLAFDLTGLPPTPEEVEAFVLDNRPDAYERLVGRLLASPRYGERWARHWMDVVRFGESQGFERNHFRPNAWKYRDWVIASLNADLPYDEFVRQQIAGDVLRPDDPLAVAATGYLVAGAYDLVGQTEGTETMKRVSRQDQLEDFVGNVGQTFLGLTINCARCHDHKFDPVSQREYYQVASALGGVFDGERESLAKEDAAGVKERRAALAAKLQGVRAKMAPIDGAVRKRLGESLLARARERAEKAKQSATETAKGAAEKPGDKKRKEAAEQAKTEEEAKHAELARLEAGDAAARAVTEDQVLAELGPDQRATYAALVAEASEVEALDRLLAGGPAHAVTPRKPELTRVLARGDVKQPGEVVAPGAPAAAGLSGDFGLPPDAPEEQRRRKLAEWVTDPRNPLAARVIVNRLWHYHFGAGLVATPNDFGFNGGRPSHPELLDWLASELVSSGWSLKKLHRAIVLSATYRQSSAPRADALAKDAGNRLLWRKSPARLEAEALRDAVLAVAGELNPRMGGPGFHDFEMPPQQGKNQVYVPVDVAGPEFDRRSVYRASPRSGGNALLATLDCPDPSVATPARTVTTTPLQALSLMNNSFTVRCAERFAERVQREAGDDMAKQVERAYRLAYGRRAETDEAEMAKAFVAKHGLGQLCLVLFNASEFLYAD